MKKRNQPPFFFQGAGQGRTDSILIVFPLQSLHLLFELKRSCPPSRFLPQVVISVPVVPNGEMVLQVQDIA
jgi:hypothetical protein